MSSQIELANKIEQFLNDKFSTKDKQHYASNGNIKTLIQQYTDNSNCFGYGVDYEDDEWCDHIETKLMRRYHAQRISYIHNNEKKSVNSFNMFVRDYHNGYALHMCDTNLICIDIDMPKEASLDERKEIREHVLEDLFKHINIEELMVDFTCSGGMHIWVSNDIVDDIHKCNKDSATKIARNEELNIDIDLFIPFHEAPEVKETYTEEEIKEIKSSRAIILPGTAINGDEPNTYKYYTMPLYCPKTPISYSKFVDAMSDIFDLPLGEAFVSAFNKGSKGNKSASNKEDNVTDDEVLMNIKTDSDFVMKKDLFDKLVEGCKLIDIHGDAGSDIKTKVGVFHIISALYACVDDKEVSIQDVEDAIQEIGMFGKLTDHAKARWISERKRCREAIVNGNGAYNCGSLFVAIKAHANEYFTNEIVPLIKITEKKPFDEDTYTFNDFKFEADRLNSRNVIYRKLARCIAVDCSGAFIVKKNDNNTIKFIQMTNKNLKDEDINVRYETTAEDIEERNTKRKDDKFISTSVYKICSSVSWKQHAQKYKGVAIYSDDPHMLSICKPPKGNTYNASIVNEWINFYKSVLVSQAPFIELLDSLAYRLRNPDTFIEKFFINYGVGGDGKSAMTYILSLMFPNHANVGVTQHQIESDAFNSWLTDNMLIWMEEAEQTNYKSKAIQSRVKQLTTKNLSVRGLYKQTKQATNIAIFGMNTNSKDLYGLVNGDNALLERLVILCFNSKVDKNNTKRTVKYFMDNQNELAYSLWYYLMKEHRIQSSYSISRYDGQEKYEFIKRARVNTTNSVHDWLKQNATDVFNKHCSVKNMRYVYAREKDVNDSYNLYKLGKTMCLKTVKDTLVELGFQHVKTTLYIEDKRVTGVRVYRISEEDFEKIQEELNGDDIEEDEEGMIAEGDDNDNEEIDMGEQ